MAAEVGFEAGDFGDELEATGDLSPVDPEHAFAVGRAVAHGVERLHGVRVDGNGRDGHCLIRLRARHGDAA